MKVLAFAASNSKKSINKALVTYSANVLKTEIYPLVDIEIIDLNDFEMPIYSIDREQAQGIPELAKSFSMKITQADALLISFAEHNGAYTAAYKNIFDWASRINMKVFNNKPVLMMSASPGKGGAQNVLTLATESAPHFGADVKASFSVGLFQDKFNITTQELIDSELSKVLRQSLKALVT